MFLCFLGGCEWNLFKFRAAECVCVCTCEGGVLKERVREELTSSKSGIKVIEDSGQRRMIRKNARVWLWSMIPSIVHLIL